MTPTPAPSRTASFAPLKTLLPFLRPYRTIVAAAVAALVLATGAMLALPVALRRVIDVLAARDAGTTNRIFAGFLAAAAIFAMFAALRFYLVTWLGERVVADLRAAVYSRVIRMDPLFFETMKVGAVLSRLTTDTTLVQAISGVNLSIILRSTLEPRRSPRAPDDDQRQARRDSFSCLMPAVVAPLILIGRRVRGLSRASQDRIADTERARRRNAERHPDGAGLHAGGICRPSAIGMRWSRASMPRSGARGCARR